MSVVLYKMDAVIALQVLLGIINVAVIYTNPLLGAVFGIATAAFFFIYGKSLSPRKKVEEKNTMTTNTEGEKIEWTVHPESGTVLFN